MRKKVIEKKTNKTRREIGSERKCESENEKENERERENKKV